MHLEFGGLRGPGQLDRLSRRIRRHFPTNCRHAARGQSLVEFALIMLALLAVTLCVIDVGRAVAVYNLTAEAARSGARVGRLISNPPAARSAVATAVSREIGSLVADPTVVVNQVSWGSDNEPYVEVSVSSPFQPLTFGVVGLTNDAFTISASSKQFMYNVALESGTPFPVATPNATAYVEATAAAQAATQTAVAAPTPLPSGSFSEPTKLVQNLQPDLPLPYAKLVECVNSGNTTSTVITWASTQPTTLYFLFVAITSAQPTAAEMKTVPPAKSGTNATGATGVVLNQTLTPNVEYKLWVYNDTNGSDSKNDANVSAFEINCPTATP